MSNQMHYIYYILIFLAIEIILAFAFSKVAKIYYKKIEFETRSVIKGTLERLFLIIALSNELPTALILFGALKIATRLKHTEEGANQDRFNDYYLIGNLASASAAIFFVYLLKCPQVQNFLK